MSSVSWNRNGSARIAGGAVLCGSGADRKDSIASAGAGYSDFGRAGEKAIVRIEPTGLWIKLYHGSFREKYENIYSVWISLDGRAYEGLFIIYVKILFERV